MWHTQVMADTDDLMPSMDSVAAVLRDRVADGRLPGAVAARVTGTGDTGDTGGTDVETVAVGEQDLESATPMAEDSLFFWDSLGKPVVAAAALTFVADGSISLETPVQRWLPELGTPRVLRDPRGALDDTVPCARQVTVGDLFTLRGGLGFIPDFEAPYSKTLFGDLQEGRPRSLSRGEYLAAAAGIPLAHQPGEGWTYNTGSTLLGLLLERVADRPLDDVVGDRLLTPLGMTDTTWWVDETRRPRFAARYVEGDSGVELADPPDGLYSTPPSFPDAAGALIGPVGDWVLFARMLLGGGRVGDTRILPENLVSEMMTDHLTGSQRAMSGFFLEDGEGWGYGGSVRTDGSYGWAGAAGTYARVNPRSGEAVVLMTQLALHGPQGSALLTEVEQAGDQNR